LKTVDDSSGRHSESEGRVYNSSAWREV
jgi:hypothetical protein